MYHSLLNNSYRRPTQIGGNPRYHSQTVRPQSTDTNLSKLRKIISAALAPQTQTPRLGLDLAGVFFVAAINYLVVCGRERHQRLSSRPQCAEPSSGSMTNILGKQHLQTERGQMSSMSSRRLDEMMRGELCMLPLTVLLFITSTPSYFE